eukprot:CAMPEP_0201736718 /NCGR_PEP_ID=MMETSP0593-20130828/40452_1 /ASSEMBLY_ACC=CAM_ASM_000672 /TAXON_ID=267983 /ORGANISM="Skeletonema japonicum, Strain CCMP2506" /LENGTH=57 /DNA_ID=CAMNT_0048230545 /DNA_START=69 /DNA_END=238 /DNA_ORIENTATION=+
MAKKSTPSIRQQDSPTMDASDSSKKNHKHQPASPPVDKKAEKRCFRAEEYPEEIAKL